MQLIIVRHGETKEGRQGIMLGHLPGNLTRKGKTEAKLIAKKILSRKIRPDIIITSDLQRAKETALIINKFLKIPIKYERLIRERKAGETERKADKEINWDLYEKKSLSTRKHRGGESFLEVKKRAKRFLLKITKTKKNIFIVSHNAFILMLLSEIFGWSLEKSLKYDLRNKIIVIKKTDGEKSLAVLHF